MANGINVGVYSWYTPYLFGLNLLYSNAKTLIVKSGSASNSTSQNIITVNGDIDGNFTVNSAINGPGGLDTGTFSANTSYAIYAIGSSSYPPIDYVNDETSPSTEFQGSVILSTNFVSPVLPKNYDMYRYIGAVITDSSTNIIKFVQCGNSNDRYMWYDGFITFISDGTSSSYFYFSVASAVPRVNSIAILTLDVYGGEVNIVPYMATSTSGYATASSPRSNSFCPVGNNNGIASLGYKTNGTSASVSVMGYIDCL